MADFDPATASPVEDFDPESAVPLKRVGVIESALRTAGTAAQKAMGMFDMAAAGMARLLGDGQDVDETLGIYEARQRGMKEAYAPKADEEFSTVGQIAGGVASMPIELVGGGGVQHGIERSAEVLERGGSMGDAAKAGATTGAVHVALNAAPVKAGGAVGKLVESRLGQVAGGAATGAAISAGGGMAGRAAENAALPEGEQFEDLKQSTDLDLVEVGMGAAFGALPGAAGKVRGRTKKPETPPFPADQMTDVGDGEFRAPNGAVITKEQWDNASQRVRDGWMAAEEKLPVGEATELPVPPKEAERLAEIERLKEGATSDTVKAALDEEAGKVRKAAEAQAKHDRALADAAELRRAAGETSDPEIQKALRARADKLEAANKVPVGQVIEGQPEIKVDEPKKPLPVGEAKELPNEPTTGRAPELDPLPVGETREVTASGVETQEVPPVGEARELYVDPARPDAAAAPAEPLPVGEVIEGAPAAKAEPKTPTPEPEAADTSLDLALPRIDEAFMREQARTQAVKVALPDNGRGVAHARKVLEDGARDGSIDKDGAALALWALDKNPHLARGLQVRVSNQSPVGARGSYDSANKVVELFRGKNNPQTAAHEILHHSEHMMPPKVQAGIRREWRRQFDAELRKASPAQRAALADVPKAMAGDAQARGRVLDAFRAGVLTRDGHYHLSDPSEFWAVNAARILNERFTGRGSWRAQARQWLREMIEHVKSTIGLRSDAPVLKALDEMLNPKKVQGQKQSLGMLKKGDAKAMDADESFDLALPAEDAPATKKPKTADGKLPEESALEAQARQWIDSLKPIERAQQAVKPKSDDTDMRLAAKLMPGRVGERAKTIEKNHVKPLAAALKAAKKAGLTVKDVDDYLIALHAPERNAVIAERNPKMADGGSGFTNKQAAEIVASFSPEQRVHLDTVAKRVRAMNAAKLDAMVADGVITPEMRAKLDARFKNYVPLKTLDKEDAFTGIGRGFEMRPNDIRFATGRSSRADSPIAASILDATRAISRGERARVDKTIWNFAQDADAKGLMQVYHPDSPPDVLMKNEMGADGKVKQVVDPKKLEAHVLSLVVDGEQKRLFVPNETLAQTLKTAGDPERVGPWLRAYGTLTRTFSRTLTEWNPAFAPVNAVRDAITASIRAKRLGVDAGAVAAGIPVAWKDIIAHKAGGTGKGSKLYAELKAAGGAQGAYGLTKYGDTLAKLEKLGADLGYDEHKGGAGRKFGKALGLVGDALSDYNEVFEYATRLSAYRNARAKGMSPKRAAAVARDITLDFNVSGEIGRRMGHAFSFFNAALQGISADMKDLRDPRTRLRMLSLLVVGSAVQAFNEVYGGVNEETGDKNVDMQYEGVQDSNIVLTPVGVKIPLPPGIAAALYTVGRRLTKMAFGGDVGHEASGILSALLKALLPVRFGESDGGVVSNALSAVVPTIPAPFYHLETNRNAFGQPIIPASYDSKSPQPHHMTARSTTSGVAKAASRGLNAATGGDDVRPGAAQDVLGKYSSPEAIEYLVSYYTGGTGQLAMQATNIAKTAAEGKEQNVEKIPVLKRFIAREPKSYTSRRYRELATDFEYARDYQKAGQPEKIDPKVARALPEYESAERELRALFKSLRATGREGPEADAIQQQIKATQSRVIRAFNGQAVQ